jgi:hypothetical protein
MRWSFNVDNGFQGSALTGPTGGSVMPAGRESLPIVTVAMKFPGVQCGSMLSGRARRAMRSRRFR